MSNFNDNDDNNYPIPIPSIKEKLINDDDEFLSFEQQIFADTNIDSQMKKVMLQSRKEYIKKFRNQNKINQKISKQNELSELSKLFLIFNKEFDKANKNNEFTNYKLILQNKINDFINGIIPDIKLEFEMFLHINNIIREFDIEENKKIILLNIIKPIDEEEYNNYVKIIEISKNCFEEQEKLKKNKLNYKNKK